MTVLAVASLLALAAASAGEGWARAPVLAAPAAVTLTVLAAHAAAALT